MTREQQKIVKEYAKVARRIKWIWPRPLAGAMERNKRIRARPSSHALEVLKFVGLCAAIGLCTSLALASAVLAMAI